MYTFADRAGHVYDEVRIFADGELYEGSIADDVCGLLDDRRF